MRKEPRSWIGDRRWWALGLLAGAVMVGFSEPVGAQQFALPELFATPSARASARVTAQPRGADLQLPEGFNVEVFAEDLPGVRRMRSAPNGDLFVAQSRSGVVAVLRDTNGDGVPDTRSTYIEGLPGVFGIAFQDGYLYLGVPERVVRVPYTWGDVVAREEPEVLIQLPGGGHSTRNIVFNRAGTKMYVAVGSRSNKSDGEDPVRAAINEYNLDGTGHRIFASGLRNPVGLTRQPGTDIIWTSVNERDTLGDDLVPDYVTSVQNGGFYGWPYSYLGSNPDPEHVGKRPELVQRAIVPDVWITAHSAALSVTFYTGDQFPERYRGGAFVGLHGSWNRSDPSGYKVGFIPFQNGEPSAPIEDFLTGWLSSDGATTWGRPVDSMVTEDGSLLVSDDGAGRIWRVRYTGM